MGYVWIRGKGCAFINVPTFESPPPAARARGGGDWVGIGAAQTGCDDLTVRTISGASGCVPGVGGCRGPEFYPPLPGSQFGAAMSPALLRWTRMPLSTASAHHKTNPPKTGRK